MRSDDSDIFWDPENQTPSSYLANFLSIERPYCTVGTLNTHCVPQKPQRSGFSQLFTPALFPPDIRGAARPGQNSLALGDHTEFGDLRFPAPECLLMVQVCLAPGRSTLRTWRCIMGRPWFRYSVEEIFRKAVVARNGRKRTKNTRCSFHCNGLILGEVARPERFELPAFWSVVEKSGNPKALQVSHLQAAPPSKILPQLVRKLVQTKPPIRGTSAG